MAATRYLVHERKAKELYNAGDYKGAFAFYVKSLNVNPLSLASIKGIVNVFEKSFNLKYHEEYNKRKEIFLKKFNKNENNIQLVNDYFSVLNKKVMDSYVNAGKHPLQNKIASKKNFAKQKILVLTCVWSRPALTLFFLDYYKNLKKELEDKVSIDLLVVGSKEDDYKDIVESCGFHYLEYENKPLSQKWQAGVLKSAELEYDGLLIVGSDDFLCKNTFINYSDKLKFGCLFYGFYDAYFYIDSSKELYHWPGYNHHKSKMPHRNGETVGMGRLISRELLEILKFSLWDDIKINSSLDNYVFKKLLNEYVILPVDEKYIDHLPAVNGFKLGQVGTSFKDKKLSGIDVKTEVNVTSTDAIVSVSEKAVKKEKDEILTRTFGTSDLSINHSTETYIERKDSYIESKDQSVDVSILIVAHKESPLLDQCIDSALKQKFNGEYEVVLASDSNKNLESYADKYGIKFSLSQKVINNTSCSKNINDGVIACSGKYIKILAYDDFLPEGSIQYLHDCAVRDDAALVFANAYEFYSEKDIRNYIPPVKNITTYEQCVKNRIHGGTILFKKQSFLHVGGYDEKLPYAEEYDFYFKLLVSGYKFSYVDAFVYYYRRHSAQKGTSALSASEKKFKTGLVESIAAKYHLSQKVIDFRLQLEKFNAGKSKIVFGVASIESRVDSLKETIKSIYDQADIINIYQNGYKDLNLLDDPRSKINYVSSFDTGLDKGDAGKFYFVNNYHDAYYFSIDDDLVYPHDYVEKNIELLKNYNGKAVITSHGKLFKPNSKNYFKDICVNVRCLDESLISTPVHFGGTGVMCFHTSIFKLSYDDFYLPNMADVFVGISARKQAIKIVTLKHSGGWIQETNAMKEADAMTIYKQRKLHNSEIYRDEDVLLQSYFETKIGAGV